MWKKFLMALGKIVQGLKDKFRRRRNNNACEYNNCTFKILNSDDEILKNELQKLILEVMEKEDSITEEWANKLPEDSQKLLKDIQNQLEISLSTPLTVLPKRIKTRGLIVSIYANQPQEYFAIDLSQLEEKGIAHMITARTESHEELIKEYEKECGTDNAEDWKAEIEEEGDLISVYIPGATLLYYEDFDYWDYEEAEE